MSRNRDTYEKVVVNRLVSILRNLGFTIIFSTGKTKPSNITYPSMKGDVMVLKVGTYYPFEVKGEGPFKTQIHDDAIGKSMRCNSYHRRKKFNLLFGENEHPTVSKMLRISDVTTITRDMIHPLIIVTEKFHSSILRSIRDYNLPIGYFVVGRKSRKQNRLRMYNCGEFETTVRRANKALKNLSPETQRTRRYSL